MSISPYAEAAELAGRMSGLQLVMWLSIGRDMVENPGEELMPRQTDNVIEGPWKFSHLLDLAEGGGML